MRNPTTAGRPRPPSTPAAWLAALALAAPSAAALADGPPAAAVIRLDGGGHAAGALIDSPRPGVLRWQGSAFVDPFEFPIDAVNAVHWPAPGASPKPRG